MSGGHDADVRTLLIKSDRDSVDDRGQTMSDRVDHLNDARITVPLGLQLRRQLETAAREDRRPLAALVRILIDDALNGERAHAA